MASGSPKVSESVLDATDDAPEEVEVPESEIGRVIGRAGSVIQRLIKATGCQIEIPKKGANTPVADVICVKLNGNPEQRRLAAAAIRDAARGGDAEDHAARAEGAMVLPHELSNFDREAWATWRMVPVEREHGVRVEMGRRAARVWVSEKTQTKAMAAVPAAPKAKGKGSSGKDVDRTSSAHKPPRVLTGDEAESVRAAVQTVLGEALQLAEAIVEAKPETEPEMATYDAAVFPLVYQHGLLLFVPRPENGRIPIKISGMAQPVEDAAAILEARYVKGKSTASVLQAPDQIQTMAIGMQSDFERDIAELETEYKVKVKPGYAVIWVTGANEESVCTARDTLKEMLLFYMPDGFCILKGLNKSKQMFELLRGDAELRVLSSKPGSAISFDNKEGTVWICGPYRDEIKQRLDSIIREWSENHWEMDLEDYGAAMWLLGPKGSGDYLKRMEGESGTKMKVCPIALKVMAEGPPARIREAEKLVREAMEKLEEKKKKEAETGLQVKSRELQSDHPPHMKLVLEKLAKLEADALAKKMAERRKEHQAMDEERRRWMQGSAQGGAGSGGGTQAAGGGRERSRSRDRASSEQTS
eukprot:TRINITY_DN76107_c0_g1_i1.p1 TRINITY_DN76107_c0_g1~~TRINITY_DN76107_c0_g1_i1.p1  ORF type:complete len:608 (-),score=114.01 TRINITY_DN76107_c0_g1_i1:175-1935(-)